MVIEQGGEGGAPGAGADVPLQLVVQAAPMQGPILEKPLSEGLHPWKGPTLEHDHEELQPMRRTHLGGVNGGLSPMEGIHAGAGEACEESSP
ncbi:hypothetical protein BTVI_100477 [Pitangus sulphuratus]|nr:hypothetical protein BTVI_100477 [Pitangus sulphuratus]